MSRSCYRHEPRFNPSMTDSAWVGRGSHIYFCSWSGRARTGKQIGVLPFREVCQLVKPYKIKMTTLIFQPILFMLHSSKINLCTTWKLPNMPGLVIACPRIRCFVEFSGTVYQVHQLRILPPEDDSAIEAVINLPQGLRNQIIAFPSTCCPAVQRLKLRAAHHLLLLRLRAPQNLSRIRQIRSPISFFHFLCHLQPPSTDSPGAVSELQDSPALPHPPGLPGSYPASLPVPYSVARKRSL